jgi:hypothetical protein
MEYVPQSTKTSDVPADAPPASLDHTDSAAFASLFAAPPWRHVQILLTGTRLAQGPRTVAAAWRAMGLAHEPRFERYHRVLAEGWRLWRVA